VLYTLTLYVKEERYKYIISNLEYVSSASAYGQQALEPATSSTLFDKPWWALKLNTYREGQAVIARLLTSMSTDRRDAGDF
jgi:hypothetical protein